MLVRVPNRVNPPTPTPNPTRNTTKPLSLPLLHPYNNPSSTLPKPFTSPIPMTKQPKRPTCPTCSKPTRFCLCTRLGTHRALPNKVHVTILQHSLETNHPLNSARIAKLALKNVVFHTVSDVNFRARFLIWGVHPGHEAGRIRNGPKSLSLDGGLVGSRGVCPEGQNCNFIGGDDGKHEEISGLDMVLEGSCGKYLGGQNGNLLGGESEFRSEKCGHDKPVITVGIGKYGESSDLGRVLEGSSGNCLEGQNCNFLGRENEFRSVECGHEKPVITVGIGKYGKICDLEGVWMMHSGHGSKSPSFDDVLASKVVVGELGKGFVVKKLQKRQVIGSVELEECEEFELMVPPGSVLLFPSDKAISVNELREANFEVTNLIVLDGTWAKARRMYEENPWLRLLPHLRLEFDGLSLYNEVRHQPKAGYFSTIESIVYGLRAIGECPMGLDNLLVVFESMVEDQRRCKDERLNNVSAV